MSGEESSLYDDSKPETNKQLFPDINADDDDQQVTEIESLCFNCHEQGVTRLLLTRIPFFREVILSSFHCDECNFSDTDVQYGGRVQDRGVRYEVTINNNRDLNRQVVKSDSAKFLLPTLDFEQPPSKKGEINTIEGLIAAVVRGLEQDQPVRKALNPEVAEKIDSFISKLQELRALKEPFKIILDDPSGNSYVENPLAPQKDPATVVRHYTRTKEQDEAVGIQSGEVDTNQEEAYDQSAEGVKDNAGSADNNQTTEGVEDSNCKNQDLKQEVLIFPGNCPNCSTPTDTKMKIVHIPFFKEVIIMATNCEACGYRENEVKSGSGVEDEGTRITLHITDKTDLARDVLKSDTCGMKIPEIDLELMEGTLGGRFTTVEGLMVQIKDELKTKNPFFVGDGAAPDTKENLEMFLKRLDDLITTETPDFTLILDDPAGNSFMQNLYAPDPDPEMTVERYVRNQEQNDLLGLLDAQTDNLPQEGSS